MAAKVFVSGCFDLLHSGHIAFLETAATFGDVYVGVAQDQTITLLKGKAPCNDAAERLYMVQNLRWVKEAWLSSGLGMLDFEQDLRQLHPDVFIVNEDGHTPGKEALCTELGIQYKVLRREPAPGLPMRSSTQMRELPYRAEICGAWLDQPFINRLYPGWVICAQMMPHPAFAQKSGGLATSTRACLAQLKDAGLARMDPEFLARLLFRYENGIDQIDSPISGAQDALGLCVPGISFQYYDNGYWPQTLESCTNTETLRWLEAHVWLYPLRPRPAGFDPLAGMTLNKRSVELLAEASALCKNAILTHNLTDLSESFVQSRRAQKALLPAMFPPEILAEIERLEAEGRFRSWKFTGAGGGGWLLLAGAEGLPQAIPLRISSCNPKESML